MTAELAKVAPQKASVLATMAARFGTDPAALMKTLKGTVMPGNTSDEQVAAFLIVANQHGLNPFTREIYAFPDKQGGIRPIVGIDGWLRMANAHPQFDGMETSEVFDDQGNVIAVETVVHRKDRAHPVRIREYMSECRRGTEPWKQWPARMLRNKSVIQALRIAFSFAGIEDEDEAERALSAQAVTVSRPVYGGTKTERLAERIAAPEPDESKLAEEIRAREAAEGGAA